MLLGALNPGMWDIQMYLRLAGLSRSNIPGRSQGAGTVGGGVAVGWKAKLTYMCMAVL